ncbi:MAG: T9SS type A sorting domain-containing protein, partial [Bacteroidia bacterium]
PDSAVHPVLHLCVDNALGLEEHLSTAENISVGPNPFSDNLILHFQKNNPEERFVTMTDYLGRTIFSTKTNSNQEELKIPNSVIESLANGIYFISVRSKNNSDSSSIKVVKQK